jgi:pimeloyl-ACP methyl ester carboxylesterase
MMVDIGDCELYVSVVGQGFPVLVLHGGPGLDHHEFGDYLHPLGDEFQLVLVDERASGRSTVPDRSTWSLSRMAADIPALAAAMGLDSFAVLGHSFGAFLTLQYAVDFPDDHGPLIISGGIPSSRYLAGVADALAAFEPAALRERVAQSWQREASAETEQDYAQIMHDQLPFHFADPLDPRIADYELRTREARYAPAILRHFAEAGYGGIEVEERLHGIDRPVLVLAGRHDRTCPPAAAQAMATGIRDATLVVFEHSGHMTFVEEQPLFLDTVRSFLTRTTT